MGNEWKTDRLADLCLQIVDCPHSTPAWTESGVIVLRNQNIRRGRLDLSSPSYTDETHYEQRSRRARLQAGDLVLTREAPMGEVCMIPDGLRCCLGQRMVMLRADPKKCDAGFLLYALQSGPVQHEIKVNEGTGATVSNLRIPLLEALQITYPTLPEQKAIARILGSLDDKIELNRRMNVTLEAMARALFQSWFVDFDPVRAKAEGRTPENLDEATAALFPDRFEDSELGRIPKGWRIATISETCEGIFSGGTPNTRTLSYWDGDIPWLSSGETRNSFIIQTEKKITEAGVKNSSTRKARSGCTVIASAGQGHTRGQTSLLTFDSFINQSVIALVAKTTVSSDLFLFFDLARRYSEFRQLSDSHSSRGSLTTKLLASVKCVLPPPAIIAKFEKLAHPMIARITANLHESCTLAAHRDTLVPRLLSGELAVANLHARIAA